MGIQELFCPRGVAVVGSTAEGKLGYELIRQIVQGGYGQVFPVNPKAQGALGIPGRAAVSEIEQPVDLVVVASPPSTVASVLRDAASVHVHAAVIITSGFSEVGNVAGEQEIKSIAAETGMRVIGPNCAGVVNTHHHLFASLETRPPAGRVAFISQSGAMGGAVLSWAEEQGVGFGKFVSYGNRADLDEIELLPYLAQDDETDVVALYIESVSDGRAFLKAVREFTRQKPLIVIKAGRSRAGERATLSHTGSLAGSFAVYDAALRDSGALRVDTVEEMFDLCKGFVSLPRMKCAGGAARPRVAIVTNSGGPGVMAADRAEALGLSVEEPSDRLKDRLAQFLPPVCSAKNPFDLTVEGTEAGYRETLSAVLGEYDAALALDVATPYLDSVALARGVCAAAKKSGKPVVANFMAGRIVADAIDYLKENGIPNYAIGERAIVVLARMAEYETFRSQRRSWPDPTGEAGRLPDATPMLEPEAVQWLRANGIPTLPFRFARSAAQVADACAAVGYPVVMKVVSPEIIHKSECGGVKLNIGDADAAVAAFAAIEHAARGRAFQGVVVYPMVRDAQEVLLGLTCDPQFGPVVALGTGGIFAEVWGDVSLRVAPVDRFQAEAMTREIKSHPVLGGARGQPPRDLAALIDLIVTVSRLPFRYPQIEQLDLNPVFLFEKGLVAGDVRLVTKEQSKR
ncbi:MAG: acetate--CoA ligase family protein [Chloroflexi bacterium]|nr:acetate--CoA ligase family protein [Chloroflexota bacterium]